MVFTHAVRVRAAQVVPDDICARVAGCRITAGPRWDSVLPAVVATAGVQCPAGVGIHVGGVDGDVGGRNGKRRVTAVGCVGVRDGVRRDADPVARAGDAGCGGGVPGVAASSVGERLGAGDGQPRAAIVGAVLQPDRIARLPTGAGRRPLDGVRAAPVLAAVGAGHQQRVVRGLRGLRRVAIRAQIHLAGVRERFAGDGARAAVDSRAGNRIADPTARRRVVAAGLRTEVVIAVGRVREQRIDAQAVNVLACGRLPCQQIPARSAVVTHRGAVDGQQVVIVGRTQGTAGIDVHAVIAGTVGHDKIVFQNDVGRVVEVQPAEAVAGDGRVANGDVVGVVDVDPRAGAGRQAADRETVLNRNVVRCGSRDVDTGQEVPAGFDAADRAIVPAQH